MKPLYIGETGRRLGDRVREHLRDIRRNTFTSDVATHFNSLNHDINDFSVRVITSIVECQKRKLTEAKLIRKLGTLHPLGLNREEDSSHRFHWCYYIYSYLYVFSYMSTYYIYSYLHMSTYYIYSYFICILIYVYIYVSVFLYTYVCLCVIYIYGDLVSWEIYFSRVWSGQPTINRRLKRTCWCDIGLKMVCRVWGSNPRHLHYMWSALPTELTRPDTFPSTRKEYLPSIIDIGMVCK